MWSQRVIADELRMFPDLPDKASRQHMSGAWAAHPEGFNRAIGEAPGRRPLNRRGACAGVPGRGLVYRGERSPTGAVTR